MRAIQEDLAEPQPIHLRRVERCGEQHQLRELIDRYHYLSYRSAYDASLRYLIETPYQ